MKTFEDIFKSPHYGKIFLKEVEAIEKSRDMRNLPKGQRFKRTAYDSLSEKGLFNSEDFMLMYIMIQNKNCNLASAERHMIVSFVENVIRKVVEVMPPEKKKKKD